MKLTYVSTLLLVLLNTATSLTIPHTDLAVRDAPDVTALLDHPDLEKRRGGGGGGHGGGGGGHGGGSSSGGGGGGRSGSSGSGSSSGSSGSSGGGRGSSSGSSNVGGATHSGSGPRPVYGGGAYYAGGARNPYRAGSPSPLGIAPFLLPIGALAFFGGYWLHPAYAYNYPYPYIYDNPATHQNQSIPVVCLCEQYQECGCNGNNNSTFYQSLFNGTVPTNSSVVRVVKVNGTETIYINGTLPNGTTVADASISSAPGTTLLQLSGYWTMVAVVIAAVWTL